MFVAGSVASAESGAEPTPEAGEKSVFDKLGQVADKAGECLWWVTSYFQRDHRERENRRFDPGPTYQPDYEDRLRRLEGNIRDTEPGFRMGDYHESGGGNKWIEKWGMPGLVTLAVSGIIGNVVQAMTVSSLKTEVVYLKEGQQQLRAEVTELRKQIQQQGRGG
jgi:hypothetical protein